MASAALCSENPYRWPWFQISRSGDYQIRWEGGFARECAKFASYQRARSTRDKGDRGL